MKGRYKKMADLVRLKKHNTMIHLNTSADETAEWSRIGKSTVFDLEANAQTETNNFIEDEMATTEVMSYEPGMSQELQTNQGDPAFDYVYNMFYELPTGEDVKKDVLITFAGNVGSTEAPKFNAWKTVSTLTLNDLNTVEEKINFNLTINKIERGTVTITEGKPVFTPN